MSGVSLKDLDIYFFRVHFETAWVTSLSAFHGFHEVQAIVKSSLNFISAVLGLGIMELEISLPLDNCVSAILQTSEWYIAMHLNEGFFVLSFGFIKRIIVTLCKGAEERTQWC